MAVQGFQHETVAAQGDDHVGLGLGHAAIAFGQALARLARFGPLVGEKGKPVDQRGRLGHARGQQARASLVLSNGGPRQSRASTRRRPGGVLGGKMLWKTAARACVSPSGPPPGWSAVQLAHPGQQGGEDAAVDARRHAGQRQHFGPVAGQGAPQVDRPQARWPAAPGPPRTATACARAGRAADSRALSWPAASSFSTRRRSVASRSSVRSRVTGRPNGSALALAAPPRRWPRLRLFRDPVGNRSDQGFAQGLADPGVKP